MSALKHLAYYSHFLEFSFETKGFDLLTQKKTEKERFWRVEISRLISANVYNQQMTVAQAKKKSAFNERN